MQRLRITALLFAQFLALIAAGMSRADEPSRPAQPLKASADEIKTWVEELDSDSYFTRKAATDNLQRAGLPVVAALEPVLGGVSLEATTRAVHILQELALSTDMETETAARTALEKAAKERVGAVSRRASAALETLNELRRERAIEDLKRLGAKPELRTMHNGVEIVEVLTGLEFGADFTGDVKDLRRLEWIGDIPQFELKFVGRHVTDAWLTSLPNCRSLASLHLNRTSVTTAGLRDLRKIDRLTLVSVWNTGVDDGVIEHIQACRGLTAVRLYGTRVTPEGIARLQQGLATAKIDFRRGGFLGIGGNQTDEGCEVQVIHPGSAADKAGIIVNDVIVKIGDKKVADFESLTQIVSLMQGGDTAEVEILRGDEKLTKKITLGEWGEDANK